MKTLLGIALIAVLSAVAYATTCLFLGKVLADLWRWFILPIFAGAPQITYLQAVGLTLVVGFFKIGLHSEEDDNELEGLAAAIFAFLKVFLSGLIFWGLGAFWAQFV